MLLARRPLPFDVALSFAGEDRRNAAKLEELLRAEGLRVYFDGEEQSDLWGKRLRRRLADVYTKESRYCVILVSLRRRLRQDPQAGAMIQQCCQ